MIITADIKMADIIHINHELTSVINRFGIQLGFGDKTVAKVLKEYNINIDFFLVIVNSFHDKNFFPSHRLQRFSVNQIVDYLKKTHRYYLDKRVPGIANLIDELLTNCYSGKENVGLLKKFFNEYCEELEIHIDREDKTIFPYALRVEEAALNGEFPDDLKETMKKYTIKSFVDEHDDIEEKLYDLKNIIIKYLPPPKDSYLCSKVLAELFYLESDMNDHARIENNVLVPMVVELEEKLRS